MNPSIHPFTYLFIQQLLSETHKCVRHSTSYKTGPLLMKEPSGYKERIYFTWLNENPRKLILFSHMKLRCKKNSTNTLSVIQKDVQRACPGSPLAWVCTHLGLATRCASAALTWLVVTVRAARGHSPASRGFVQLWLSGPAKSSPPTAYIFRTQS